jgi:dipeptidyl aminopeptidase/acylaminoacyl peptidase
VIHGTEDVTVPYTNSYRFANGLANRGVPVVTAWLSGVDHFGPMQSLMFDPEGATEAQVRRFAETWVRPAVARL